MTTGLRRISLIATVISVLKSETVMSKRFLTFLAQELVFWRRSIIEISIIVFNVFKKVMDLLGGSIFSQKQL